MQHRDSYTKRQTLAQNQMQGARPLVLLHGFAQDSRSWDSVAPLLRDAGFDVHALDYMQCLCGNNTLLFERGRGMELVCAYVVCEIRRIARTSGQPVVLVGYSQGGRIVFETLVRHGYELPLAACAVESGGIGPANDEERRAFADRAAHQIRHVRESGPVSFFDQWEALPLFQSQRKLGEEVRARVRKGRLSIPQQTLEVMLDELSQSRQSSREVTIEYLRQAVSQGLPMMYIAGELDTKYAAIGSGLSQAIPELNVVVVPRAGHNVHLEQPAAYVSAISAFLQQHT